MLGKSKDFVRIEIVESNIDILSEELNQVIENNKAIAATDASVKEEKIGGSWIVEDAHIIYRREGEVVSNQ